MHGDFFWYEVMTADTAGAAKFYCDVIGWGTQNASVAGVDYSVFTVGGAGVAGLMAIPAEARKAGAQPCWMGYIAVDDVDQAAERIAAEGGRILRPPADVPGVIRFAVAADPQGAAFLIAKGLLDEAPPAPPPGAPGTIGWRELYADEWTSAFAFYERMFGWTKAEAVDMGEMGTYQLFANGGEPLGGMMTKPSAIPAPHWGYYFNVSGIDSAGNRVSAGGGRILNGPMQVPGGQWVMQCMDPQGAAFSLVSFQR